LYRADELRRTLIYEHMSLSRVCDRCLLDSAVFRLTLFCEPPLPRSRVVT
jgi:hypothetical protein